MKQLFQKFYNRYPYTCLLFGVFLGVSLVFSLPFVRYYFRDYTNEVVDDPKFYLEHTTEVTEIDGRYYIDTIVPAAEIERFRQLLQSSGRQYDAYHIGEDTLPNGNRYRPMLSSFELTFYDSPYHPDDFYTIQWRMSTEPPSAMIRFWRPFYRFTAHHFGWGSYASDIVRRLFALVLIALAVDILVNLYHDKTQTKRRVLYAPQIVLLPIIWVFCMTANLGVAEELYSKYQHLDGVYRSADTNFIENFLLYHARRLDTDVYGAITDVIQTANAVLLVVTAIIVDNIRRARNRGSSVL